MMPGKKVITDSMDSKEIIALLHEDFAFGQHKYDETCKHYEKLAKGYSHRKDRVDFKPLSFKSAVGFNYVFRYYKRAANDNGNGKIGLNHYVWFTKGRGIYAISRLSLHLGSEVKNKFQVYTPHFFDRYRERYLKDATIPKLEVVQRFAFGNPQGAVAEIQSEKYPNSVWTRCDDGLMLCTKLTDDIYECKTFISFEMTGFGERHFIDFTAEEGLKRGFEFKLPYENFNDFREE
jgi:hypothetical protein